jgi:predicted HTH domain antitoxin
MPDKPTSEQIRRESDELREIAVKLMEHAATLIARAVELEKKVALLNRDNSQSGKP